MWYLVLSRANGSEEARKAHLREHMDWLLDAHRAGSVLFSGPTADKETGIYVMVAASLAEAEAIAAADPHHVYGERTMEVMEWDAQRSMRLDGPTIEEISAMAAQP
jgi:uncharacterized protein YciI